MKVGLATAIVGLLSLCASASAQNEYNQPGKVIPLPPHSEDDVRSQMNVLGYSEDSTSDIVPGHADPAQSATQTVSIFRRGHYAIVAYPIIGCALSVEYRIGRMGDYSLANVNYGIPIVYVDTTSGSQYTDVYLRLSTPRSADTGCPFRIMLFVKQ